MFILGTFFGSFATTCLKKIRKCEPGIVDSMYTMCKGAATEAYGRDGALLAELYPSQLASYESYESLESAVILRISIVIS